MEVWLDRSFSTRNVLLGLTLVSPEELKHVYFPPSLQIDRRVTKLDH